MQLHKVWALINTIKLNKSRFPRKLNNSGGKGVC